MSYEPLGQGLWYFLTSFVGTLGFAILLHAPKRAWLPASLIGAMTYTLYWSLKQLSLDEAASMFLAALFGSLLAQFCARKMRMIATIFLLLSVVALVPGLGLYRCMSLLAQGNTAGASAVCPRRADRHPDDGGHPDDGAGHRRWQLPVQARRQRDEENHAGRKAEMSISVMAMGRMKEKPYRQMADEYLKRLSRYGKFEEIELPDLPEPANTSEAIERQIRDKEGEMMLSRLKPSDYVIALTIPGKMHDSPGLSRHLDELLTRGESSIVFVIGGSLGLGNAVIHRANEEMSMSKMTFPHQLARVMLLEQLYRAMKIRAGERYHK